MIPPSTPSSDLDRERPIDPEDLSRDPAAVLARQEPDRLCDFLRLTESIERVGQGDPFDHLVGLAFEELRDGRSVTDDRRLARGD